MLESLCAENPLALSRYSKDVKIGDFLLTSDQIVPDRVVEITEHVMEGKLLESEHLLSSIAGESLVGGTRVWCNIES